MRRGTLLIFVCLQFVAIATFASSSRESSQPVVGAIREFYPGYLVESVIRADGSVRVQITADGTPVFESRWPVEKADGKYLEWQYRVEPLFSNSTRLDGNTAPKLDEMTVAAKEIVRMIRRGQTPESSSRAMAQRRFVPHAEDNYGCDWPFEGLSCTTSGNCCDTHDLCYYANSCDVTSWLGLGSAVCAACNAAVTACITAGIGTTGRPSYCCITGTCGLPRPADGGDFGFGGGDSFIDPASGIFNLQQLPDGSSSGGFWGGGLGNGGNGGGGFGFGYSGLCTMWNGVAFVTLPC